MKVNLIKGEVKRLYFLQIVRNMQEGKTEIPVKVSILL